MSLDNVLPISLDYSVTDVPERFKVTCLKLVEAQQDSLSVPRVLDRIGGALLAKVVGDSLAHVGCRQLGRCLPADETHSIWPVLPTREVL